jgi:hypothetical protein
MFPRDVSIKTTGFFSSASDLAGTTIITIDTKEIKLINVICITTSLCLG